MKPLLLSFLAALFFAGCASPTVKLSDPNKCLLIGNGIIDYDTVYISFATVDGAPTQQSSIKQDPSSFETTPGTHKITYNLVARDPDMKATGFIKLTTVAGKTYKFVGEQKNRIFRVKVFEMQGKELGVVVFSSGPIPGTPDYSVLRPI